MPPLFAASIGDRGAYAAILMCGPAFVCGRACPEVTMEIGRVGMPAANALDKVVDAALGSSRKSAAAGPGGDFASLIKDSLAQVSSAQGTAESMTHQFQLKQNDVSLEDAMLSIQKANISLQTTIQVRNKLVSAYNDIMNMQL